MKWITARLAARFLFGSIALVMLAAFLYLAIPYVLVGTTSTDFDDRMGMAGATVFFSGLLFLTTYVEDQG